uniref:uncharacterized protein troap isoform X2 n=1 Tax=Doryrhamphus excisus TaxID=161450 RepID=UPI0025ADE219|nr:uncharacterized protein troap isoform X2 [Doryrhamphus excisus]
MDPSPVLRVQSQNNIGTGFLRINNENKKMAVDPKNSNLVPVQHLPHKDSENQDPRSSKRSRLPVLVRTLRPAASDFRQWEDKALTGKAKKKKSRTRPIPFITAKHNTDVVAMQPTTVVQSASGAGGIQLGNSVRVKPPNITAKHSKCSAELKSTVDSNKGELGRHGLAEVPLGQRSHSGTTNVTHHSSTSLGVPSSVSVDVCSDSMTALSLKGPTKICHWSHCMQDCGKTEKFRSNHTALLSILHKGSMHVQPSPAPQSKPSLNLPQRVSVAKTHQTAPPTTVKSVAFSPDPCALRSILQNEGVKAAGPMGATPLHSSGRHTSIYTAQRVPVRKNLTETQDENLWTPQRICNTEQPISAKARIVPVSKHLAETAQGTLAEADKLWTPQRVPNTRHQPLSSKIFHTNRTPRLRRCETNQPHQKDVVQRLFVDHEDGQSADKEHLPVEAWPIQTHCEKVESITTCSEEKQLRETKPFIPTLQRESVIFFSTGKKIIQTARFEKHQERHGWAPPELGEKPMNQMSPVKLIMQRDNETCGTKTAVALLRKCLPPVEELRLDDEVSFYISPSASGDAAFPHLRPDCRNPVAFLLHFEESIRFVPLGCDASPCLSPGYK